MCDIFSMDTQEQEKQRVELANRLRDERLASIQGIAYVCVKNVCKKEACLAFETPWKAELLGQGFGSLVVAVLHKSKAEQLINGEKTSQEQGIEIISFALADALLDQGLTRFGRYLWPFVEERYNHMSDGPVKTGVRYLIEYCLPHAKQCCINRLASQFSEVARQKTLG
jgi:hypothetical protein